MKNLVLNQSILRTKFLAGISFLFLLLNLTILSGCLDSNYISSFADSSSDEAKYHEGQMAVDDGNYTKAVAVLEPLVDGLDASDSLYLKAKSLLASAYGGAAGFDTLELMDVMIGGSSEISDPAVIIGSLLGDADGNITTATIAASVTNLESAIGALADIPAADRTDSQKSQLATLAAYHLLAEATSLVVDVVGSGTFDLDEIADTDLSAIDASDVTPIVSVIVDDFEYMDDLPESSPFYEPFQTILDELDGASAGSVDADDITAWIESMGT